MRRRYPAAVAKAGCGRPQLETRERKAAIEVTAIIRACC
jgi:hypothetical protein